MKELTDVREIRKLLDAAAFRGERIDGNPQGFPSISVVASLVRQVMDLGRHQGYSGEDTMTLLAYHALLRYEQMTDQILYAHNTTPTGRVILTPDPNSGND